MDVKGAYLNGTLKEKVLMRQPEGYDDGSGRVCLLEKTLYGLKQSGCEWNIELDKKLRQHGFTHLIADPCAYVRREGDNLEILTIWVDDLLLFATGEELMERMKQNLHSEWEVTDLGELAKIVGIEISRKREMIRISQERYIESERDCKKQIQWPQGSYQIPGELKGIEVTPMHKCLESFSFLRMQLGRILHM